MVSIKESSSKPQGRPNNRQDCPLVELDEPLKAEINPINFASVQRSLAWHPSSPLEFHAVSIPASLDLLDGISYSYLVDVFVPSEMKAKNSLIDQCQLSVISNF